jgi:hypothetical protein
MFSQLLSTELTARFPSLQFDMLVCTTLALFSSNASPDDTIWDLSNRICDRYFTELKQDDHCLSA